MHSISRPQAAYAQRQPQSVIISAISGLKSMPPMPDAAVQIPIISPTLTLNQRFTRVGKLR